MLTETERARWETRLAAWKVRLRGLGLDGLAAALLEAAEPFSLIGAQVLYVAQPALGVFMPSESVGRWARLLEDPATLAWMRAQLTETGDADSSLPGEEGQGVRATDGPDR